jgi:hypothetical protein
VSSLHLWPITRFFCYCRTFAVLKLKRGRVCTLLIQFTVSLRSKYRRTHDHTLLSHLRLSQPGGPGPCIYISQEQGGPVIVPGTGFPFCRLLRLAGLRRRYSNPPPPSTNSRIPFKSYNNSVCTSQGSHYDSLHKPKV